MILILLCSFLTGLTGFTALSLCVMRVMIVDVAPPHGGLSLSMADQRNSMWSLFWTPPAAWALQTSIKARTRLLLQRLFWTPITSLELPTDPTPPPIPGTPQSPSKHGNPAALIACCWLFFCAIAWVILLVPETKPATVETADATASLTSARNDEDSARTLHDAEPPSLSPHDCAHTKCLARCRSTSASHKGRPQRLSPDLARIGGVPSATLAPTPCRTWLCLRGTSSTSHLMRSDFCWD